jgi:DNA-binding NtrC family response regulator
MKKRILLVDDEAGIRASLKVVLEPVYDTLSASSAQEGLDLFRRESPHLVLLDVVMPGMDGLTLLKTIRDEDARIPVIMLTGTKTVKTAVEAMKLGAADYLSKPFDVEELRLIVAKALETGELEQEVLQLRAQVARRYSFHNLIGKSPAMQEIYSKIEQVADTKTTVLITGESGTGKELVARALHYNSSRRDRPFIALNSAALPETLIESELFGHEKGSFTDAHTKKLGQFELAHEGTLFLDEIGEMGPGTQAKLLRVLEHGEFLRVGGTKSVTVDVRIIAATNRDLSLAIKDGGFRPDLYYRLNVVTVNLPPLRERRDDLLLLLRHFTQSKCREMGIPEKTLRPEAVDALLRYPWPGNVRELENLVERLLVLCEGPTIGVDDLPESVRRSDHDPGTIKEQVLQGRKSLGDAVDEFEREIIQEALRETDFNQTRAAEMLGTTRRILKYRMDKLGIAPPA